MKSSNNRVVDITAQGEDQFFAKKVESFWTLVWRRFRRHKLAMFGTVIIIVLGLCALLAPIIAPYPPEEMHFDAAPGGIPGAPSPQYLLGTDNLGRDYLSRCLYGGRISLLVGVVATGIALLIGIPLGCLAGYFGGVIDMVVMRFTELLSCIPTFFLILTINILLKPNIFNVMVVLGLLGWMGTCRQIRAQFLKLKEQDFVAAGKALGLKKRELIIGHILPNALTPVIVSASMSVASAILTESSLSYLGLGVQEPAASWGSMLQTAQRYSRIAPWMALWPGILVSLVILSLNFIGDGLRDALDPKATSR